MMILSPFMRTVLQNHGDDMFRQPNTTSAQPLSTESVAARLTYWQERLTDIPHLPLLTKYLPGIHPDIDTTRKALPITIDATLTAAINSIAQRYHSSPYAVLLTSLYTVLYRHSWQTDICIAAEYQANLLPLRVTFTGNMTFAELLSQVNKKATDAIANQIPFSMVMQSNHCSPLPYSVALTETPIKTCSDYFDICLSPAADYYQGGIQYNPLLFDEITMQRLVGHLQMVLQAAATNLDQRLLDIPILLDEEKATLKIVNQTEKDPIITQPVHEYIATIAKQIPNNTAVVFHQPVGSTEQITYRELDHAANELAMLLNLMGVEPDKPVGVSITRSINLIITILAILKAGGVVVPMETKGCESLYHKLTDTALDIVLVDEQTRTLFQAYEPNLLALNIANKTNLSQLIKKLALPMQKSTLSPAHLAYIMYTSGTTGKPKGVMIPHGGLTNLVDALLDRHLQKNSKVLCTAPPTFDCFFFEMLEALAAVQGEMHMIYEEGRLSPSVIQRIIQEHGINIITVLPKVLDCLNPEALPSLVDVICMGAPPSEQTLQRWIACGKRIIIRNEYGPTEATICVTEHPCQQGEPYTCIGNPIRNTQIFILDPEEGHSECPPGVSGEIYIKGSLARGYVDDQVKTQEKFLLRNFLPETRYFEDYTATHLTTSYPEQEALSNLASRKHRRQESVASAAKRVKVAAINLVNKQTVRLYRTGDRAYRDPLTGKIIFLGRVDRQVKINGVRVELDGLEALLREHPDIRDVAIIPNQDQALVAFIVPKQPGKEISNSELNDFLRKTSLPAAARPQAIVMLPHFPLTINGKIDTRALPTPTQVDCTDLRMVEPTTNLQKLLFNLWRKVLNLPDSVNFGITQQFTDLGGDSLSLARLETAIISNAELQERLDIKNLSANIINLLSANMTIYQLAERLEPYLLQSAMFFNNPFSLFQAPPRIPPTVAMAHPTIESNNM